MNENTSNKRKYWPVAVAFAAVGVAFMAGHQGMLGVVFVALAVVFMTTSRDNCA